MRWSLRGNGLSATEAYEVPGAVGWMAVAIFDPEIDRRTGVAATADDLAGSVGMNRVLLEFCLINVLRSTGDRVVGILGPVVSEKLPDVASHVVKAECVWGISFDRTCGANVVVEVGASFVRWFVSPGK